ncbi:MAG: signal recognition particle-docking protein FtsY [Chloroflexota bacterium]
MTLLKLFRRKGKTESSAEKTKSVWSRSLNAIFRRGTVDESFWEDLEETLVTGDVGASTTMAILDAARDRAEAGNVKDPEEVRGLLRADMVERLRKAGQGLDLATEGQTVALIVGVNGAGKTTSIAKLAYSAKQQGSSVLMAAADTFRAGAIEQIKLWGDRVGVEVIAHQPGGDPGAVVYDAIEAGKSRGADLVLVDTAGRLHTRHNLMEELRKVRSIANRQSSGEYQVRALLVIDGTTGQNGLQQARAFTEAVDCDGVILTKLDGTARGGVVLAIAGELNLPVWLIGTGESMDDIAAFEPEAFVDALLSGGPEDRGSEHGDVTQSARGGSV